MAEIITYRADSMQEALRLVRRELGPDALILRTRQCERKKVFPWQKSKLETEIVAVKEEAPVHAELSRQLPPRSRATNGEVATALPALSPRTDSAPEWTPSPAPVPRLQPEKEPADHATNNALLVAPLVDSTLSVAEATPSPGGHASPPAEPRESERLEQLVHQRLDALQQMIERLTQQVQTSASPEIPAELFDCYLQLMEADVEEDYAREILRKLRRQHSASELACPEQPRRLLRGILESEIHCSGPILPRPGQQKVVALIGPTGVGKTTTIAKLASNFRLREGMQLGLITVDTYRIAAVEQLRTYVEIIDLPMQVVTTPDEMERAMRELAGMDLILIDTAGRSPHDEVRVNELKTFLDRIVVDEIHLVLSATTSPRNLRGSIEKFRLVEPTSVILTKLDEAPRAGAIATISGSLGLPISYLATGQNVPRDIEPAERSRAVRLVLGEERITV
ncbi:MAG: flagellar biosynthesis protein FlhF [Planctomycetaceae bacterium]